MIDLPNLTFNETIISIAFEIIDSMVSYVYYTNIFISWGR